MQKNKTIINSEETLETMTIQVEASTASEAEISDAGEYFRSMKKSKAIRTPSEIIAEEPDGDDYLIKGILKPEKKLLLVAPPKAGKTNLAVNLALGIASGTDILDFTCKQGTVLYVDCETGLRDVVERLYHIAEQRGIDKTICDNIKFYDPYINYRINASDLLREISEQIEYGEYKLVVIDSFYCVFDGDENSSKDVSLFVRYVDEFIEKTGSAVLIIHHEGKKTNYKKSVVDRACGSNVFGRFFDGIISLSHNENNDSSEGISETIEMCLRAFRPQEPINVVFKDCLHSREKEVI